MSSWRPGIRALAWGTFILLCVSLQSHGQEPRKRTLGGGAPSSKQGLGRQDCLGCHKAFADKYMGMKNVHAVVKENKCDQCHLRHGLVDEARPEEGRQRALLHLPCQGHDRPEQGPRPHRRQEREVRRCCHNPHASAERTTSSRRRAATVCYQCHEKARLREGGRPQGAADERVLDLPLVARRRPARPPGQGGEGPVPRLPRGERAGLQEGPRRLPGRPGVRVRAATIPTAPRRPSS